MTRGREEENEAGDGLVRRKSLCGRISLRNLIRKFREREESTGLPFLRGDDAREKKSAKSETNRKG